MFRSVYCWNSFSYGIPRGSIWKDQDLFMYNHLWTIDQPIFEKNIFSRRRHGIR